MVLVSVLISFSYMLLTVLIFTVPLIEDGVVSALYILTSLGIDEVPHRCMDLSISGLPIVFHRSFCFYLELFH